MSDVVEPVGEIQFTPVPADQELQVLIEGIDEIPAAPEPEGKGGKKTKEELAAELERTQQELTRERTRNGTDTALVNLVEEMRQQRAAPQGPHNLQRQPSESEEQFQERYNKEYYDNPYKMTMEFQLRKLAPEVQRIMIANLGTSRKLLLRDPERGDSAKRYLAEIDREMEIIPANERLYDPDIYEKVHDRVVSRHSREIIDEEVKKAVAAALNQTPPNTTAPKTPGYTERGTAPSGGGAPRTIILTPSENADRLRRGIPKEQYAAFLLRHPEMRIK